MQKNPQEENKTPETREMYCFDQLNSRFLVFKINRELMHDYVLDNDFRINKKTGKARHAVHGSTYRLYDDKAKILHKRTVDILEFRRAMRLNIDKIGGMNFGQITKIDTEKLLEHCRAVTEIMGG